MSRRIALIAMAFSCLASCNQQQTAADGYRFEKKEYEQTLVGVRFVVHPSIADLRAAAPREAIVDGRTLMAWSKLGKEACEVHIVDPAVSYQPEWIGHEITHCVFGRWHT